MILATSIAESSLTIEGVRVVVDSGLARVPRYAANTGMTRLETVRVSQASADQRAGRAGRLAPGIAWRLWSEGEHATLLAHAPAEIVEADLTPLVLDLAAAGVEAAALSWIDPPRAGALAQGRGLLQQLDCLDHAGRVTPHGTRVAAFGTHPRLAHLLVRAHERGEGALACDLVALLEDRDPLQGDYPTHDADLRLRVELVRRVRRGEKVPAEAGEMRVRRDAVLRIAEGSRAWRRELGLARDVEWSDEHGIGRLVALAFPDRVARRRGDTSRFLLRSGGGVVFRDSPALAREPWVVVAETDGRQPEAGVYLAAPLSLEDVRADFADQLITSDTLTWDDDTGGVRAQRTESLGAIVLRQVPDRSPDPAAVLACVRDHLLVTSLGALRWSDAARTLRERLACVHHHLPGWLAVDDATLSDTMDHWLVPRLAAVHTATQLQALDLGGALLDRLDWEQRRQLDALAPTHFMAPTGSRLLIDYADPVAPLVRVRLQELFGLADGPRVLDGRVRLTLHLLSPAHRPVQVTQDLAGFWRSSYLDVKKEMKGRYPRHHWPDDPMVAEPTRRAKPRGT